MTERGSDSPRASFDIICFPVPGQANLNREKKIRPKYSRFGNFIASLHQADALMERIFAKSTLRQFWEIHSDSEQYLKTWYDTAMSTDWKSPNDVRKTYASASILKDSRIVFNIKGNAYRLVAKFNFEKQWIFIRFTGSHSDDDKIDANTI